MANFTITKEDRKAFEKSCEVVYNATEKGLSRRRDRLAFLQRAVDPFVDFNDAVASFQTWVKDSVHEPPVFPNDTSCVMDLLIDLQTVHRLELEAYTPKWIVSDRAQGRAKLWARVLHFVLPKHEPPFTPVRTSSNKEIQGWCECCARTSVHGHAPGCKGKWTMVGRLDVKRKKRGSKNEVLS